jgi:ketosteroid isomerase-like protein
MSQENVDNNIRELVAAFNRGDADTFAALCLPDVEWEDAIFWTEESRMFRGSEGVRDWVVEVREPWEELEVTIEEIVEAGGNTLLVPSRIRGRGRGSGVETQLLVWQVMSFADGKTSTRKVFRDRAGAPEAAGLSE